MGPKSWPETSKMDPKNLQNGGPNLPKSSPNRARRGPGRPKNRKITWTQQEEGGNLVRSLHFWGKWSQHGSNFRKKRFKKATQQKWGRLITGSPLLSRKSGQHGPKLGSKIDQKSIKNLCKNRSFFWCLLGSIYGRNLVDFWSQNEAKLGPKWDQKSMWTSNGDFSKNLVFLMEKQSFLESKGSK